MRPSWNGWGLGLAAVAVAAFVILFAPAAPVSEPPAETIPTTQPAACEEGDDLCRAVDLLEELRDDPTLTPQEREAVDTLQAGIDDDVRGTTTAPPPATTTSTTTTTTVPLEPRPPLTVADEILHDLLPTTTIPEGAGDDG